MNPSLSCVRHGAADQALAHYDFGEAYRVSDTGAWNFDDFDDWTCSVRLEPIGVLSPSFWVSFHVRFLPQETRPIEVIAYERCGGNEVGVSA